MLNGMTAIEAKLDALMTKLGNQERRMHLTYDVGAVKRNEQKSSANEGLAHEGPYQVEEAQLSMEIEATTLSQTSTCQPITHQH